ncbi:MAG: aminopeptidase [Chitinophagaceae bacterium]|nr:aminopeptidase [Oligoflexus sp.]
MRLLRNLFTVFILLPLCTACYTLEQAFRFNNSFNSRVFLGEMLNDPELPADKRTKLELARQTLVFAQGQGLNVGDAYQFVIPDSQRAVSYSVQAAKVDKLELITWWFPFAGSVPYLGYFNIEKRDAKSKDLRGQGYDVSEGTVGAFSSLGWFSDPLYFSMLSRSEPDTVQLLLHELVHRSFWSKGSPAFNENLAEAVSLRMTEVYLKERHKEKDWNELQESLKKQAIFRGWLVALKNDLTALYARGDLTKEQKIAQKAILIKTYQDERFPKEIQKEYDSARRRPWNNASILGSTLYLPDMARFKAAYDCLQPPNAGAFLAALHESEKRSKDADEGLSRVCELKPKVLRE